MNGLRFLKMHGLGNDFVVLDGRVQSVALAPGDVRRLADRRIGIGCDQLIVLGHPEHGGDVAMRIWNSDAGEVESCGNATRCIARLVMAETARSRVVIETKAGDLTCDQAPDGGIAADMGAPSFAWDRIPLARPMDTLALDFARGGLTRPAAVNVGNPHVVFFVDDPDACDLAALGPEIEHDPLFPARVNVSLAQVVARDRLRLRVWERGAGLTRACGTAACAALACAVRLGLADRRATITLPGGDLTVEWRADDHLILIGPAALSFHGEVGSDFPAISADEAAARRVRGIA